jgi:hypothetical protein
MGENTDSGLVLEGAGLEDARQVIGWAIRDAADCLVPVECGAYQSAGDERALLVDRARVGRLLGEPGSPSRLERPLASDDLTVLTRAAEQLADMSAYFAGDEGAERSVVAFLGGAPRRPLAGAAGPRVAGADAV